MENILIFTRIFSFIHIDVIEVRRSQERNYKRFVVPDFDYVNLLCLDF